MQGPSEQNPPSLPPHEGGFLVGTWRARRSEVIVIAGLAVLIVAGAVMASVRNRPVSLALPGPSETAESPDPRVEVIVHVIGAVRRPGVYTLVEGARVAAAVRAAGGFGPRADRQAINLARPVSDGEQIAVPRRGESGSSATARGSPQQDPPLVNVNTADSTELESLPGIGPALAGRIIDHRTANGPFATVDDLLDVSGIGPKTLERLRPYITV